VKTVECVGLFFDVGSRHQLPTTVLVLAFKLFLTAHTFAVRRYFVI
jgi:hypothetical protein